MPVMFWFIGGHLLKIQKARLKIDSLRRAEIYNPRYHSNCICLRQIPLLGIQTPDALTQLTREGSTGLRPLPSGSGVTDLLRP